MDIENWRSQINNLDDELLGLLTRRARLALKVGEWKQEAGASVCDHTREREVIERMCRANPGPLDDRAVVEIFRTVIHESRRMQTQAQRTAAATTAVRSVQASARRVAFQGERGAFSEEAAVKLLGPNITLVPRPTFASLFRSINEEAASSILAPIENSLAGFVHECFDLLLDSKLFISGEVIIPIKQCLIGCPGASFESIVTVESHPVALNQCHKFLAANPQLQRIVTEDTAGSVARILASGDLTRAAIAGRQAAERYGGVILGEHLEDSSENYTRFFLLESSPQALVEADKMSLTIELPHQAGALHRALGPFAQSGIDLLKIEGRPVKGRPWEYCFYLELRGSESDSSVMTVLKELVNQRVETRILGSYRAAPVPIG